MSSNLERGAAASRMPSFQLVVISGVVRDVVASESAAGETFVGFDLAVDESGDRTLVPVTWRGAGCPALFSGDRAVIRGRVAKRFHRRGALTVVRTAVDACEIVRSPRRVQLERLLTRAHAAANVT